MILDSHVLSMFAHSIIHIGIVLFNISDCYIGPILKIISLGDVCITMLPRCLSSNHGIMLEHWNVGPALGQHKINITICKHGPVLDHWSNQWWANIEKPILAHSSDVYWPNHGPMYLCSLGYIFMGSSLRIIVILDCNYWPVVQYFSILVIRKASSTLSISKMQFLTSVCIPPGYWSHILTVRTDRQLISESY